MQTLHARLTEIRKQIRKNEVKYHRTPNSVQLLAISKTFSSSIIADTFAAGQTHFGESYPQEALSKIKSLAHIPISWHFVGQLQSNKTQIVAKHFDWVHSVDRFKIAKRLNDQRPENFKPLNICLQINIDQEPSKAGLNIDNLANVAQQVAELPKVKLRGLMVIPMRHMHINQQRQSFKLVKATFDDLNEKHNAQLDTLSMGMSNDYEAAIAEGATIIRLGTAIFGPRPKNKR